MKRSEINRIIQDNTAFLEEHGFCLPPFAFFTPEEWAAKGHEYDEIRDNALGWDITDFGLGDFEKTGLFLFTLRNGNQKAPDRYPKPYAEKVMIVEVGQVTPFHYHWYKMEDIINRGGGELVVQLYNADGQTDLLDRETPVTVHSDGRIYQIPAGGTVRLKPGESITLHRKQYHSFWAEGAKTMVTEVSQCNDDAHDNRFLEPVGRFPQVEEDEKPAVLLCSEYPAAAERGAV
ncbi:MAG: D-lyxose/D-mannose family sugar isomerase [Clostridia bacterium]|nr:D-lyxose/D-mannose family sugar isomerase [Clostridia bacterium]